MARIAPSRYFAFFATGIAALALAITGIGPATAAPMSNTNSSNTVNYVNLGDSYSAGFGSGQLRAGPFANCWQSDGETHVTKIAAMENVHLLADAACAGMTTAQISAVAQQMSPYLAAADLTTLTLGGNDLDLHALVLACSTVGTEAACQQALAWGHTLLPSIGASAHRTLQVVDAATSGTILVLGYPRLFTASAGDQQLMSASHARELNKLGDALNRAIRNATDGTTAKFVPVLGPFNDHGLGATNPWIYFNPVDLNAAFNLHPTTTGYVAGYFPAVRNHIHMNQLMR